MESRNISQELEVIIHSKRIPNALIFEADGSETELKISLEFAKKISENTNKNSLISIVGGGDTVSAIKNNDIDVNFTHLSTAGGAFLEYIEGKNLPGIEVLK